MRIAIILWKNAFFIYDTNFTWINYNNYFISPRSTPSQIVRCYFFFIIHWKIVKKFPFSHKKKFPLVLLSTSLNFYFILHSYFSIKSGISDFFFITRKKEHFFPQFKTQKIITKAEKSGSCKNFILFIFSLLRYNEIKKKKNFLSKLRYFKKKIKVFVQECYANMQISIIRWYE